MSVFSDMIKRNIIAPCAAIGLVLALTACGTDKAANTGAPDTLTPILSQTPSEDPSQVPSQTPSATSEPTITEAPTPDPTATPDPTPTPEPFVLPEADINASVYTEHIDGEDVLTGNKLFDSAVNQRLADNKDGLSQDNTLYLSDDGAFMLVKVLSSEGKETFEITYVFQGRYTLGNGSAILSPAEGVIANLDLGTLDQALPDQGGTFTEKDSLGYLRAFNTSFLGDSNGNNDMYVRIEEDNKFTITGNARLESKYTATKLSTERDGMKIFGMLTLPSDYNGSDKLPIVIFAHGFSGSYMIQQDVAYAFAEYGIASYRFDFIGGAPNTQSEGDFKDLSMLTEKADLHAVVEFIKTQEFVDTNNIFLFGESMGGAVAALVAAERPDDIKGIMNFYPAYSITEDSRAVYPDEDSIPDTAQTAIGINVSKVFYADAIKIDIFKEIEPYKGNVLDFHGDMDTIVKLWYVQKAHDVYASHELIVYNGEGHGFTKPTRLKAMAKMIEFVQDHLD